MRHRIVAACVTLLAAGAAALAAHCAPEPAKGRPPARKITTFLMFTGKPKAEKAIQFYVSLFKDSRIVSLSRYGKEGPGAEGSVAHAIFTLNGEELMASDGGEAHNFTFTPSVSLYVTCETREEIDGLFKKLSEGGEVAMPLDRYPFSERFGWLVDPYGVSWQLNLRAPTP